MVLAMLLVLVQIRLLLMMLLTLRLMRRWWRVRSLLIGQVLEICLIIRVEQLETT